MNDCLLLVIEISPSVCVIVIVQLLDFLEGLFSGEGVLISILK